MSNDDFLPLPKPAAPKGTWYSLSSPEDHYTADQVHAAIRADRAAQAAQFNGFDIRKLPPILISCVAKLWPGSNGLFWDLALERMPDRIGEVTTARATSRNAGMLSATFHVE
jgi:hypothetical protein